MIYITTIGSREYRVEIIDERTVSVNGQVYTIDFHSISDQPVYSLLVDGRSYEAYISSIDLDWQVLLFGHLISAQVEDERERRLGLQNSGMVADKNEFLLKAPMPGLVISVPVEEGQFVENGDILVILESMKMQNELKAPRSGTVTRLRVKPGDSVEMRQNILSVV
jgi:acetyl/propionyl-CoA carboxylase alpha subunit